MTLVTQGSLEHFHYLLQLAEAWDGPITAAVFLNGGLSDMPLFLDFLGVAIGKPAFLRKAGSLSTIDDEKRSVRGAEPS